MEVKVNGHYGANVTNLVVTMPTKSGIVIVTTLHQNTEEWTVKTTSQIHLSVVT